MFLNFVLAYAAYLLGASIFILDKIAEYKRIADAHPDTSIIFNGKIFWKKEWVNIVKILLLGFATMILLIPLGGITIDFNNAQGQAMFTTSVKVIALPLYLVMGWSGGKGTIAVAGKYKKELYDRVGITEDKS